MSAALLAPPALEPVSLTEAKAHLRLPPETSPEDDLLAALVSAARLHVERATKLVLITQSWRLYLDAWPTDGVLALRLNPVLSVDAITVYGADGAPELLPTGAYSVDTASRPGRVAVAPGTLAPGRTLNGIEVDLTAGFGPSGVTVPQPLRLAILMLATRWYEGRDGRFSDSVPGDIADAFEALIAPYRVVRL